ncbi:MAG: penicillin-binding protein 1A [Cellvibrionaceae bacterium]|nr:penicillin-binding protein 1A [Cellvibrionaceae bacterium]
MLRLFIYLSLSLFLGIGAGLAGIYLYLSPTLPSIEALKTVEFQTPLRVYSIDNKLIGEFGEKRRDPISIVDTPQLLVDAVLSAEDDGFYQHRGVSFKGLLRAAVQLAIAGEIQSGGSTITMQVARNFFLSLEQTFSRKFNEILLALKIERELSKAEILELYFNKIYFGNRAYGVKAAAQVYYGKAIEDLSLAQVAMIAGLPKAPSTYNPLANPSRALIRRDWILQRMLKLGKIDKEAFDAAINEPVSARYFGQNLDFNAPYVAEMAREKALALFGEEAYIKGYKVYTTIHSQAQQAAQSAIAKGLIAYDKRHGYRGPERQLDPALLNPLTTVEQTTAEQTADTTSSDTALGAVNLLPWLMQLRKIAVYGQLEPAAVIRIDKRAISVLTQKGQTVDILWENGLQTARKYINENLMTKAPESAADVVSLGDVVRIRRQSGEANKNPVWHLSQLPKAQAALVAIKPDDGAIHSLVGGFDFNHSHFNRVTQAKRQPGSNFKPFVYTAALENRMTAASILNDAPIVIEDGGLESAWRPENASGKFYGPTRLRKALYLSRNLVSIRLLQSLGIDRVIDSMERFGMNTKDIPRDLSMALGSYVMTPLQVASAYSSFANGGYSIEPYLVHHIRDRNDKLLFQAQPQVVPGRQALTYIDNTAATDKKTVAFARGITTDAMVDTDFADPLTPAPEPLRIQPEGREAARIIDERVAYIMNSMLRDVVKRGTGRRALSLSRSDLAGKTGTTNGPRDAWFSGYNPQLVATTWVGFDNNQKLGRREYGGVSALPIWIDYMGTALAGTADDLPAQPDGILTVRINPETGQRAAPTDPNGLFELFLEETAPAPLTTGKLPENHANTQPESLF